MKFNLILLLRVILFCRFYFSFLYSVTGFSGPALKGPPLTAHRIYCTALLPSHERRVFKSPLSTLRSGRLFSVHRGIFVGFSGSAAIPSIPSSPCRPFPRGFARSFPFWPGPQQRSGTELRRRRRRRRLAHADLKVKASSSGPSLRLLSWVFFLVGAAVLPRPCTGTAGSACDASEERRRHWPVASFLGPARHLPCPCRPFLLCDCLLRSSGPKKLVDEW